MSIRPFPPHLLLLRGEDRTEAIKNFEYVKGKPLVRITFKSGKTYTYNSAEVIEAILDNFAG